MEYMLRVVPTRCSSFRRVDSNAKFNRLHARCVSRYNFVYSSDANAPGGLVIYLKSIAFAESAKLGPLVPNQAAHHKMVLIWQPLLRVKPCHDRTRQVYPIVG
jgi:hypothetical protein